MLETTRDDMGNVVTLEDGMDAPQFSAEDSAGNVWNLNDILAEGKRVVLYFYPKDSTPGCTKHCLLYTSPSPRDRQKSRMPSSA